MERRVPVEEVEHALRLSGFRTTAVRRCAGMEEIEARP